MFGVLAIRRQGIYFAMITLALAQMMFFVALQAQFTGGEDGLQGVPRGKLFGVLDLRNDLTMYYVALAVVVAGFLLIVRTIHSPFGQVLKGIKENEPRAMSLGYDVSRFKLLAFVISAALSGLAGSLKTLVLGFATLSRRALDGLGPGDPDDAGRWARHAVGPAAWARPWWCCWRTRSASSATCWRASPRVEWFNTLGESVTMVTGLIFVICVLAFRRGIMGEIIAFTQRRRGSAS